MKLYMKAHRLAGVVIALLALASSATASAQAPRARSLLVLSDDGGLDPGTAATLLHLTARQLGTYGLQVSEIPAFAAPYGFEDALRAQVRNTGAARLFVLRVMRLGTRFILQLEERDPSATTVLASASLSGPIEDADLILPRLVDAVLRRQPVASTATPSNLSAGETRPYRYSEGTNHFVLGLPFTLSQSPAYGGISLGYLYETDTWGLGIDTIAAFDAAGTTFATHVHGDYFFLRGPVSPYIGCGLGYTLIAQYNAASSGAMGAVPELGVELLRLHHVRLRLAIQGIVPFYPASDGSYLAGALAHISIAF